MFTSIQEKAIEAGMTAPKDIIMEPTVRSLNDDLVRATYVRCDAQLMQK